MDNPKRLPTALPQTEEEEFELERERMSPACKVNLSTRTIILYDNIDNFVAAEIADCIPIFQRTNDPIFIKINSFGGTAYDTIAIMTDLLALKNNEVNVEITGIAFSGAAMIALCGDHIKMSRIGSMMLHFPVWSTSEKPMYEHKVDLKQTEDLFDRVYRELLERTKMSFKTFKEKTKGDFYVTPREALKYKFIDEIY